MKSLGGVGGGQLMLCGKCQAGFSHPHLAEPAQGWKQLLHQPGGSVPSATLRQVWLALAHGATPCHATREAQRNRSNHNGRTGPRPLQGQELGSLTRDVSCHAVLRRAQRRFPKNYPPRRQSRPQGLLGPAKAQPKNPAEPSKNPSKAHPSISWDAAALEEPPRGDRSQAERSGVPIPGGLAGRGSS